MPGLPGDCGIAGEAVPRISPRVGRFLCWLGWHDFHVIDATFGFGTVGNVEKVKCLRCGVTVTRQA
jgi:hypothetical protein